MQRLVLTAPSMPAGAAFTSRRTSSRPMALFGSKSKTTKQASRKQYETVVLKPNYNIPTVLLGTAGLAHLAGVDGVAWVAGILGAFLAFQAGRVKFVFDADSLEVVIGQKMESSENAFVGGENRWRYDTFVNWEYWWPSFPVLVYFKETQTKPEGQIHFFPIIMDSAKLLEVMAERCGPSQTTKVPADK